MLQERAEIARRLGADLFLSIHADSAGERERRCSGASVYTLSEKASDEAAARFASAREQRRRVNGDLARRAKQIRSAQFWSICRSAERRRNRDEFARLIAREGQGRLIFHPDPHRSAALAVLRAPDVPSVLFEAGFVTNADDAKRLASPDGKQRFADTLERAIRVFFARNSGE